MLTFDKDININMLTFDKKPQHIVIFDKDISIC